MAVTRIKFVTIVGARGGSLANVDLELTVMGSNWESINGYYPGAVHGAIIDLPEPIQISNFNFDHFDIHVGSTSSDTSWLLLESIYIVDVSPGSPNQILLGIPNWPKNLWFCKQQQLISGGYVVTGCNLGVIAKMAN